MDDVTICVALLMKLGRNVLDICHSCGLYPSPRLEDLLSTSFRDPQLPIYLSRP